MFRYIADSALEISDLGDCLHCERTTVPAYDYHGEIIDPLLAANVALAQESAEIFAACAECIHGGNLRHNARDVSRIQSVVNSFAKDRSLALQNYHRIPSFPLMVQDRDWPMCCGDWCEYRGYPADEEASIRVPSQNQFWNHGPVVWQEKYDLVPESLREVCLFNCFSCARSYFIWQPT